VASAPAPAPANPIGKYVAPLTTDCRSPCPALNTLANHGVLPHDGKNINYDMLHHALIDIMNLSPAFGTVFAKAAIKKFANPSTQAFTLCDALTNLHTNAVSSGQAGVEHSASLTREDRPDFTHTSDATQIHPSQVQINILLQSSTDKGGNIITLANGITARNQLWAKSYAAKPALQTDPKATSEHIIASVELCLVMGVLSGNSNDRQFQISKTYAQSILFGEQFPAGWSKTPRTLGFPELFECLAAQGLAWAKNEITAMAELPLHWFGVMA